jgi:glutamate racemase
MRSRAHRSQRVKRRKRLAASIAFVLFLSAGAAAESIIQTVLHDQTSFYYLDAENYPRGDARLPIGVFDSGTGGLTVLNEIVSRDVFDNETHRPMTGGDGKLDFGEERFVYLGDQANMPYGAYPAENNTELLREHILKDLLFLLGRRYYLSAESDNFCSDKEPVKAIVVACNTATAYGGEAMTELLKRAALPVKVIGVIDAGARAALDALSPHEEGSIGVLATVATVTSNGYGRALQAEIRRRGRRDRTDIFQQGCVATAGAIDGSAEYLDQTAIAPRHDYRGPSDSSPDHPVSLNFLSRYGFDWSGNRMLYEGSSASPTRLQINSVENHIAYDLVRLLEQLRATPGARPLRAIILGCTHFPFYRDVYRRELERLYDYREQGAYLYRQLITPDVALVDPATRVADELYSLLSRQEIFANASMLDSEFYISVPNKRNPLVESDETGAFPYHYKYGRAAGSNQEFVRVVPFSRRSLPAPLLRRLELAVPAVFRLIVSFNQGSAKLRTFQQSERIS